MTFLFNMPSNLAFHLLICAGYTFDIQDVALTMILHLSASSNIDFFLPHQVIFYEVFVGAEFVTAIGTQQNCLKTLQFCILGPPL